MTSRTGRGATLVEIILSVGVLAILGVFVAQLFVGADTASRRARDLDRAVVEAQNAVEIYRLFGSLEADVTGQAWGRMGRMLPEEGRFDLYYDADWQETGVPIAGGFLLSVELSLPGRRGVLGYAARKLTVRVVRLGDYSAGRAPGVESEIFTLEAVHY